MTQATPTNELTAFVSDGFSLGNASAVNDAASDTYVSWNWKAGGITNKSALFSGAGSNIATTLANSNFTSNYSISFWVNLNNANTFQNFTGNYKSSGGYGGFTFMSRDVGSGVYRYGFIWWTGSGSNYNYVDNNDVVATSGVWAHLVATKASGALPKLYVNGTASSLNYLNSDTDHGTTSENFTIGNTLNTNYSAGLIDQVRVFNKEISAAEVTTLYNETSSTINTLQVLGDTSCIAAYPLGINANDLSTNYNGTASNVVFDNPGHLTRNNNGTIESTVSASQESGFSIVKYKGNGTAGSTVGHGLSAKPEFIIIKNLDGDIGWIAYDTINNVIGYLHLDDSLTDGRRSWAVNNTDPTSTLVTLGNNQAVNNTGNFIMYCFHSVDGYQRIGSYVGNSSSTNGPFIFTGFEPAWVIIKQINGANHWVMKDNKRSTSNPRAERLSANLNNIENTGADVDFFTNGFQIKSTSNEVNDNNDTYFYLAIAANPDTTAPTKANSFKTLLYSGNSTSGTGITGVGFKPDLTWVKIRTQGYYHFWHDSVRLVQSDYYLVSSDTVAQGTGGEASQRISSFDDDGFTISGTGNLSNLNRSPNDYVSWNWKALDHDRSLPSINNDGESSTIVSVNNEAGFGIVKGYVASNGYTATLGHGFNTKPELIIYKPTSMSAHWYAYSEHGGPLLGSNNVLTFSGQGAASSDSLFNITNKTFVAGATATAHSFIAYCWRSISGHSKIGTYTISSASDRVITGLGFTPSWVMVRRTDNSGAWVVTDTSRGLTKEIYANLSNQENTDSNGVQSFDTDGFTVGTGSWLGAMNGTYLYMAFK